MLLAPTPTHLTLAPDDVHVALVDVRCHDARALEPLLDDAERARAARFASRTLAEPWIIAHAALRDVLARAGIAAPRFVVGAHGKPALVGRALEFNLSHSGALAVIAIAHASVGAIGIDVEEVGDAVIAGVAERSFSPHERAQLAMLAPADQLAGFFRCWARKEAYIKAHGLGLALELASFDVSVGGDAALLATRPDAAEAARWRLRDLAVGDAHAAALVTPATIVATPQLSEWPGARSR